MGVKAYIGAASAAFLMVIPVSPAAVGAPAPAAGSVVLASEQAAVTVPAAGLERLLEAAARQNPLVLAARGNAEALVEDYRTSRASRLPSFGISSNTTLGEPATTLTLSQPLFSSGRISAEIAAAEERASLGESDVAVQLQELLLQLVDVWAESARQHAVIAVHREALTALRDYRAMMERRVAQAVSARSELALIESRIISVETELARSEQMLRIGRRQLEVLTRSPVLVPGDLVFAAEPIASGPLPMAAEAINVAVEQAPTVNRARQALALAEAQTRIVKAGRGIELIGRLEHRLTGPDDLGEETVAYLALQFAPGPGLSAWSRSRSARAEEGAARYRLDNAREEVRTSLLQGAERVSLELDRADKLARNADSLRALLASYERQFAAGTKSWLEVLNTLREVAGSRQGEVIAQVDAIAAWYRLRLYLQPRTGV